MKLTISWPGMVAHMIVLAAIGYVLLETPVIEYGFYRVAPVTYAIVILITLKFPMFRTK